VHSVPFLPSLLFQPTDLSYGKAGKSLTESGGNLLGNPKNFISTEKTRGLNNRIQSPLKKPFYITLQVSLDISEVYILK
jgi:hypothetical protein